MNDIIEMNFSSPRPMNMNPLQRSVYVLVGLGIIISSLVAEPVSAMWFAIVNATGIALVTSAIIGRGVRLSKLTLRGKKIGSFLQPVTAAVLAVALSVTAMTNPALSPAWMAITQLVSIVLMVSAILNMNFVLTEKRLGNIETFTSSEEDEWTQPQTAKAA